MGAQIKCIINLHTRTRMLNYFIMINLYRLDVAIIVIFLYFLGSFLGKGLSLDFGFNILIACLISFISVNFIYSLNSWFDSEIDKLNKPERPIPSGKISKKQALIYSIILGIISIIYPIIIFYNRNIKYIFFIFPLIGILYSNKFFSFKKNKYLSMLLIIFNAILVTLTGYLVNNGNKVYSHDIILLLIIFILSCIGIIPLKDIGDEIGDEHAKNDNWNKDYKKNKLILLSIILCSLSLILAFFINNIYLSWFFRINLLSVLFLFIFFYLYKLDFNKFYNALLKVFVCDFIIELILFMIFKL